MSAAGEGEGGSFIRASVSAPHPRRYAATCGCFACRTEVTWRIFLHQTALVGPVINTLDRSALLELPDSYNYPIFFKKMYGAEEEFDDLTDVVTLRYDIYFRDPEPDWYTRLKGPDKSITWLKNRLSGSK